ncbi:11 TM domain-containing transmembrane protein [Acrasis kona]|uniref:11 TM domain-containing transmembrane protein n=1 Tax=Acrasis kona TaxID=1008807 RepID=A0AAW2ZAH3_9EUKA
MVDRENVHNTRTQLLTPQPLEEVTKESEHGYGSFVAYCFSVNYILGVGVLGVPNAFYQGGIVVGPLALLAVTIFAMMSATWILETMARAQAIYSNTTGTNERDASEQLVDSEQDPTDNSNLMVFHITHRKFEMNELCKMFLGTPGKLLYELCVCLYLYGALWSYGSVFAESMALFIPLPIKGWYTCDVALDHSSTCNNLYMIYIGIFALMVVPLTCLNLTEQKSLQVVLTIFRYVALGLMIVITAVNIGADPYSRFSEQPHITMEPTGPYKSSFNLATFLGLSILFPTCIYSQILHHSIPGLSQPARNKKRLNTIYGSTFITTLLFYVILGIVLVIYYGPNIRSTCSLNFGFWRAGVPFGGPIPGWATAISFLIVLFPAIDVISAFPLNGITLGNNLHTGFFASRPNLMNKRWIQIIFRMVAAVPPLIGALFVRDLSKILSYVGLVGFIITFVFPPILNIVSRRLCDREFGCWRTHWTVPVVTSTPMCIVVAILGFASVLFCVAMNIYVAVVTK